MLLNPSRCGCPPSGVSRAGYGFQDDAAALAVAGRGRCQRTAANGTLWPRRARLLCLVLPLLWFGVAPGVAEEADAGDADGARQREVLNQVYFIDGQPIRLVAGAAEKPAAAGSAARIRTRVSGRPVFGDLDGDGDEDAVLWFTQRTGGSGTFFYVAAAIREPNGVRGGHALSIGDRIAPGQLAIRNGVVFARYRDRGAGEPMATPPAVDTLAYFTLGKDGRLRSVRLEAGEVLLQGWLIIERQTRSFRPCGRQEALWLWGVSPAWQALRALFRAPRIGPGSSSPRFVSLVGREAPAPATRFGQAYAGGFLASRLVQAWRDGRCEGE